jgi:hypothetical protein
MSITGRNIIRAVIWLIIAGLFGAMPFIALEMINEMSEVNVAAKEIAHLIKGVFIVFICCAIIGAVVADFISSQIKIRHWLTFIAIYVSPFAMLLYLCSEYLTLYIQYEDLHPFGPGARAIKVLVAFTVIYALAAKTYYYRLRRLTTISTNSTTATTGTPI